MIEICGNNKCNQLSKESSSKTLISKEVIGPPIRFPIDPSLIKSYTISSDSSIVITYFDTIHGVGNNTGGRISPSLPRKYIYEFTEFTILNENSQRMIPISAVCCYLFTVYIVKSSPKSAPQLAKVCADKSRQTPLFLNLNGRYPISLYSSRFLAAAIDNEGGIVLLDSSYEYRSEDLKKRSFDLPQGEKAVCVAFGDDQVFALSSTGKVYQSKIPLFNLNLIEFSSVIELNEKFLITSISGFGNNVFTITNEGKIFGIGNVGLGFPKDDGNYLDNVKSFTEISALNGLGIKQVFAGFYYTFFVTEEGKVFACGNNGFGQLNIVGGATDDPLFMPVETRVKKGCTFCITNDSSSAFFINCEIPPEMPNRKIDYSKESSLNAHQSKLELFKTLSLEFIESFTEKKFIGKGGESLVYLVEKDGKKYALKEFNLLNNNICFLMSLSHLIHEFEAINKLNHPNIIKSLGLFLGDSNHSPSILLEFCPFNLLSCVKKLSNIQKVCAVFEIVSAMADVHKNKMIHRDLKPGNILFDESMHVKICDFGIARFYNDTNSTKTTGIGTLKFMAPELLNEVSKYSEKVDVYSFGFLLFFILSNGQYPKISIAQVAAGKKATIPEIINTFSKDLISRCWSTDSENRPSFAEVADEIKRNNFGLIDGIENEVENIKSFLKI